MTTIDLPYPALWKEYALLDTGDGERLERFGEYIFRRPDPQILWKKSLPESTWDRAHGSFVRTFEDKGEWKFSTKIPDKWLVHYDDFKLWVEPTPFKHLGVFPEQASHWDWMRKIIQDSQSKPDAKPQVLNLFGYTGGSSIACAKAGAFVTHVDASRPSIAWAKENQRASGLPEDSIRWILDDVLAFVRREVRRGKKYDAILMDPPSFGHGAKGEVWKFHTHFPLLLEECAALLSDTPLFVVVNAYAVSVSSLLLFTMLDETFTKRPGETSCGELLLKQENSSRLLSTGIFGRRSFR